MKLYDTGYGIVQTDVQTDGLNRDLYFEKWILKHLSKDKAERICLILREDMPDEIWFKVEPIDYKLFCPY